MSLQPEGLKEIAAHALRQERTYDWTGASQSYRTALNLLSQHDSSAAGDVLERLGYASYRAAMQAKAEKSSTRR